MISHMEAPRREWNVKKALHKVLVGKLRPQGLL
jgi:hypothetical protein